MSDASTYHHGDLRNSALAKAIEALDAGEPLPSLRELARRCGVTHPALYRHFSNQLELTLLVAAQVWDEVVDAQTPELEQLEDPFERLVYLCRAQMQWAVEHPHRWALLMGPDLANQQSHPRFLQSASRYFGVLVEAVMACGVADPLLAAHVYGMAVAGFAELTRKGRTVPGGQPASLAQQIDAVCEMILAHARSTAASAPP